MLSTNKGVEFTYSSHKYSSIFLSYIISFVAFVITTYFVVVVESMGIDCLCDIQEIDVDPRLVRWPKIDIIVSFSPSNFESEYPIRLKSSSLEY